MNRLIKIINEELENISDKNFNILVNEIVKRVPILKQYNKLDNGKNSVLFQKISKPYLNKKKYWGDLGLIEFESITVVSEFVVSYRYFNEAKWFYFSFKNEMIIKQPKDIPIPTALAFIMVNKMINERYSFYKEIMLKDGKNSDPNSFNNIINDLNKKTFEFDDFLQKQFHIEFY